MAPFAASPRCAAEQAIAEHDRLDDDRRQLSTPTVAAATTERPRAPSNGTACRAGFRPCRSASCSCSSSSSRSSSSSSSVSGTTTNTKCCRRSRRAAIPRTSRAASTHLPDLCTILKTYLSTAKFCFIVWLSTLDHRLHRRLFPRLLRPHRDHADGAVSRLHDSVLDLERHPHDLVDSAARPQRARQPRAHARPSRRQAGRMAALFAVLGRRSRSPISSRSSWWCRSSIR